MIIDLFLEENIEILTNSGLMNLSLQRIIRTLSEMSFIILVTCSAIILV